MRAAVQHPDLGPCWHVTWIVSHTTDRDTIAADGKCLEGLEWATVYCRQARAGRNAAAAGFGSGRPEYRNRFQVRAIATAWPARKRAFAARRPMIALPRGPRAEGSSRLWRWAAGERRRSRPARPRVAGARRAGRGPEHHPTRPCFPPSRSSKCTWGDFLHPEGSPGFHRIMTAPLQHHPPDPETISMPSWAKQQPRACGNSSQRGLAIGRLSAMAYLVLLFALLLPSAGNAQGATDGVCGRTQQVLDELVRLAGAGDCASVTADNLAAITTLDLDNKDIASLQAGDFAGLTSLVNLRLRNNQLSLDSFPGGLFSSLPLSIRYIEVSGNPGCPSHGNLCFPPAPTIDATVGIDTSGRTVARTDETVKLSLS